MRIQYTTMILKNFVSKISSMIIEIFLKKNASTREKRLIFLHFLKAQQVIHIFFFIYFYILNLISICFFFKFFSNIDNKKCYKIFTHLNKFKFLNSNKIVELIHAISVLVTEDNEKIHVEKKSNFSIKENDFIENIVIGSGPSGSITALELKKNNLDILLIEQGYKCSLPKTKHPGNEFLYKWKFSGLSGALGNPELQYASAECYGGGSEINSGLYHEIDNRFVEEITKKNDLKIKVDSKFLNEITDIDEIEKKPLVQLRNYLKEGAKKLNYKNEDVQRFINKEGNDISKNSMTKTLLKKYEKLEGKFILGYKVTGISEEKNKCKIILQKRNEKFSIYCKNLFVCCGAPYSLNLLKKSKIIKQNINDNFHFHPMFKVIAKFPKKVNDIESLDVISSQITEFYPDFLFGNAASGKKFLKIATFSDEKAYQDVEKNFEYMSIFHSTFSMGKCELKKLPFINEPLAFHHLDKEEIFKIKDGIKKMINFLFICGADYIYLFNEKITGYNQMKIEKILRKNKISLSAVHLLGGLSFGSKSNCPLDINGKIKNINSNIYVNDSSLITENLLKNPQGAILTLAKNNITNFISLNK